MDPLRTLVEHLDANDPATAAHGRAAAYWCSRIAAQLRLDRNEHNWIVHSAQLHDVGERLLADYGLLVYRDAVRHHHERFDGRGYPDGLRADRIPFVARIVAVADAYDEMTGRRPYRFPMTPDRALLEIERSRGTQFDPAVVEVMLAVVGSAIRPVAV
jgi:HD-GYP domain-containing protein (c-di-GMP phosphodiesterase class II)